MRQACQMHLMREESYHACDMHLTHEESLYGDEWLPCDLMRALTRRSCVIRLHDTGAVMQIHLSEPLEITRACLACALLPITGLVRLGPFENHQYTGCAIHLSYTDMVFPAPMRFQWAPMRIQRERKKAS